MSQSIFQSPLWRVQVIHPEAYLHQVTVQPDSLIVEVRGSSGGDTTVQLRAPAYSWVVRICEAVGGEHGLKVMRVAVFHWFRGFCGVLGGLG